MRDESFLSHIQGTPFPIDMTSIDATTSDYSMLELASTPASYTTSTTTDPARTPTTIYNLPPEIFSIISSFLTPYETVKLSIASMQIYQKKADHHFLSGLRAGLFVNEDGTRCYIAPADNDARWDFLKEIEPTLPDHQLCHYCRIFHSRGSVEQQSLTRQLPKWPPEKACNAKEVQFKSWDWGFGWADVYAVMSRDRFQGNHGRPLADLDISMDWTFAEKYKNMWNHKRDSYREFTSYTKLDSEARIVNHLASNHLMVHRVQRLWTPIHSQGTAVLLRYGAGEIANDFKICSHHNHNPFTGEMNENFIVPFRHGLKVVLAAPAVLSTSENVLPRLIKRCEDCPTEYEVTFHVHSNRSVEIILDVWQNFGQCHDPRSAGWVNCWGRLNPHFCDSGQFRGQWLDSNVGYVSSDVAYVRDKSVFSSWAGKSEIGHHSAKAVLRHWDEMHCTDNEYVTIRPNKRIRMPNKPAMTQSRFNSLKQSFTNARYQDGRSTGPVPFPDFTEGLDGPVLFAYTRYWEKFPSKVKFPPNAQDGTKDHAAVPVQEAIYVEEPEYLGHQPLVLEDLQSVP